jgi:NADH-quinone oxidoreductase subunit N
VASKAAVFAAGLRVLTLGAVTGTNPGLTHLLPDGASITQTILVLAAVGTMTWGNFAALRQQSLQRMLAYSSIAHAGYLLMTAAVAFAPNGLAEDPGRRALGAIVFYFVIYLVMNLAAFFFVTLLRRDAGTADVSALRGLGARQPLLAVCFAIVLFSLTGLPPTAGFIGKLQLFAPVVHQGFWILAAVGLLNGAVSLYFYAKPIREMFLAKADERAASPLRPEPADVALVAALTVPLVVLGLFGWDGITRAALDAVARVP